ncbi:Mth938-like domain-containing protein [Jannaschia sp. W003]|uniref:Mth938-like domain-containing protein n=1 Tax=Jannaschia sp. W003 TaxID=2867012 RepID=UPI0021A6AB2A|nr:Mth938-like domain-containing protein [Jannaschia sp. W003]UWQ22748.1 Mth938-like domain-containing protein [Jannaschia sp. W003]
MDLRDVDYGGGRPFDGYGDGFFRIGGARHEGALILHPGGLERWEGLADAGPLLALAGAVDVILLGMGGAIAHPPASLRVAVEEAGIGLEVMATPPACRTYNVLLGEGRRVAAAVLPVAGAARRR